jgi:hypothetical protein
VPYHVVEVDAQRRFVLKENHAELARQYLLADVPVPVVPLAAFLFRDRGIISLGAPDERDLVSAFRQQYGYFGTPGSEQFSLLFDPDTSDFGSEPWLEPWDGVYEITEPP